MNEPLSASVPDRASAIVAITDERPARDYVRWPDEVKSIAFQLWGWRCNRNCAKVREELLARGYDVPLRTLEYWARAWPDEYARRLAALAPDLSVQVAGNMYQVALDGSFRLAQLANDLRADPKEISALTRMVEMAVDRIGFSPLGRSAAPVITNPDSLNVVALPDFASMSAEERRDWEITERERIRARLQRKTR